VVLKGAAEHIRLDGDMVTGEADDRRVTIGADACLGP
jgi:hypothetical protein